MRLKILLQSKFLYIIFLLFIIVFIFIKTYIIKYSSVYSGEETSVTGVVVDYSLSDSKLSLTIMGEEKVIAYYYYEEDFEYSNLYGKEVIVTGEMYLPSNNTVPNTFNYKEYMYYNEIYYLFSVDNIEFVSDNFNLKNVIVNRVSDIYTGDYLLLFLLGDKSGLDEEMYFVYQLNGIAHLLAISGLHINLFILILEKILRKLKKVKRNFAIILFLIFYSYLTSFSVSVLRCVLFFVLKLINEKFEFNISNVKLLFITAFLLLCYSPFYIYSAGFEYSFIITFFLLNMKNKENDNYFKTLFKISLIAFLASFPITVNMNFEINLSSVLFNIFFVPYVSFIVFPLSLLTFIFPCLDIFLSWFINIFEFLNLFCNNYLSFIINIPKMSYITWGIYYVSLYLTLKYKKKFILLLVCPLIVNKLCYKLDSSYYVYYMDIGQGDCSILISPYQSEVLMIDTGGNYYYSVSDNVILFLKSLGITTIDLLVITHGDSDHALDAENIYNNITIKSIMFNLNELNDLELSIKELGINEVSSVDLNYFNADNLNLNVDNENDASIVLYFYLYNYNFLFTGDIGTDPLTELVNTYNLTCDFYKVAHHGSNNNTSEFIISKIMPTYAFISAGLNNIYNHPSEEVIEILNNFEVVTYQTLIDGTICVEVSKNTYNISTFPA